MNKVDEEILEILKEVFQIKRVNPMESDDNMRLWIIRVAFVTSVFCIVGRIFVGLSGREITAELSAMVNTPIAFFFTVLFLHINNKSENISLVVNLGCVNGNPVCLVVF